MNRLVLLGGCLALAACNPAQKERVETTVSALCSSVPLAQIAYNVAVQNRDNASVNLILNTLQVSCPTVLAAIHTYQPPLPAAPPPPAPTPERG